LNKAGWEQLMSTLERVTEERQRIDSRLRLLILFLGFWVLVICGRLVQWQIVEHDKINEKAEQRQWSKSPIPALRGTISDRNGNTLAVSVPMKAVSLDPVDFPMYLDNTSDTTKVEEREKRRGLAFSLFEQHLKLSRSEVEKKISTAQEWYRAHRSEESKKKNAQLRFVMLKRWIPLKDALELEEKVREGRIQGLHFEHDSWRSYPYKTLAAHILGSAKQSNLVTDHKACEYNPECRAGWGGVEFKFDTELKGTPGLLKSWRGFEAHEVTPPKPGTDLQLTIHSEFQHEVEKLLEDAVKAHGAKEGRAVFVDPWTGDVLALAQYPTFDPNETPTLANAEARRLRMVTDDFEPGSVMKVVTTAAAHAAGIGLHNPVGCVTRLGPRTIHDDHPSGMLTPAKTFITSSNQCSVRVGLMLGSSRLHEFLLRFGFDRKTGIELPGETSGLLQDHGKEKWSESTLASAGLKIPPRIVLAKYQHGERKTVERPKPERVLPAATAAEMRQLMYDVVEEGTARNKIDLNGYRVAGKTGTAKRVDRGVYVKPYDASFVGFAPLNRPVIAGAVTLMRTTGSAGYGGTASAPVFGKMMKAGMRIFKVAPDSRVERPEDVAVNTKPEEKPRKVKEASEDRAEVSLLTNVALPPQQGGQFDLKGTQMPDFRGKTVRAVLEEANQKGLKIRLMGSGLAKDQLPRAGAWLDDKSEIVVRFGN
jgi:cell division protein FtsI (penicillin-binding protein 3)